MDTMTTWTVLRGMDSHEIHRGTDEEEARRHFQQPGDCLMRNGEFVAMIGFPNRKLKSR